MTADMMPNFRARIASRQLIRCPIVYTDGVFCATGTVEDLTSLGIRVRGTQPVKVESWGTSAIFRDPDGNQFLIGTR